MRKWTDVCLVSSCPPPAPTVLPLPPTGWLFKLQLTNPAEYDDLLSEEAYKALLDE